MAGAKEIRTQIKSVQNTQKITTAMQMVAASKMRTAQQRMSAARPYAEKIRQVIGHLAQANPEYRHPFLVEREAKRIGYIVVSSDRGLAGGLNSNLFRKVLPELKAAQNAGQDVDLCLIGNKAVQFFGRLDANVVAQTTQLGDRPRLQDLIGAIKVMLDAYRAGTLDKVVLCYNEFVNTMTQAPTTEQLLPVPPSEDMARSHSWDYLYEPSAPEALDQLLVRYVESVVYQSVVENIASEQAARMVAMKAASDNAGQLIDDLQLAYNKARQAAITQELSEIVAGAGAV
ncbi:F0F1 ATP synthase subunit gamma [Alkalilimnicola sp. S0819]|uniref:F0F1 ATP synthase subunit gamma n=1 Tax=Alkalilimnicola sp. S0819 TaxID=2613922 RepID=UPI00126248E3|nr:F0F1 ATP synthase subunit gamma [Alkalilimnicola sp. S0819]KAB7624215.1 F0F1 ATP synthase subunit gamma [Alkalilimnicola sp. S0819]MPQ16470.1 F0F1 ATP synthase subunit gamma [Alkalilimnicola sp. S0819]